MQVMGHELRTFMTWYLGALHVLSVLALFHIPQAHSATLAFAVSMYALGAMGITAGVHRLWAHRSYKAAWPVRLFLVICNSIANQGSVFHWSRDHRVHHKHSDTDADPHNVTRGLFFSHMGWLLVKKHPKVIEAGKTINMDDLRADPIVMFQHRTDPWMNLLLCFGVPTILPHLLWGEGLWTAFVICGALRYIFTLHCTWMVNSAAHYWGDRPYAPNIHSAENWFVSMFAAGEGWHNWHHKYPFDYAASEYGVSSQFNPTKLFIDTCARFGLVWDRKRAVSTWESEKARGVKTSEATAINRAVGG